MSMSVAGRPVRTTVRIIFVVLVAIAVFRGVADVEAMTVLNHRMSAIVHRLDPLGTDNAAVLQSLTDAETGLRGYELTGRASFLQPYHAGLAHYPAALAEAERLAPDPEARRLLTGEAAAAARWVHDYAVPAASAGGRLPSALVEQTSVQGKGLFDDLRARNAAVAAWVATAIRAQSASAGRAEEDCIIALILVTVVALGVTVLSRGWLRDELARPLEALATTIATLTAGDHSARAPESGVSEVRSVARAVNDLAEVSQQVAVEQERRVSLHSLSATLARHVREHLELGPLLAESVATIGAAVECDRVAIRIATDGELGPIAADWTSPDAPPNGDDAERTEGSWRRFLADVAARGELYVADGRNPGTGGPDEPDVADHMRATGVHGMIVCPLRVGDELLGTLALVKMRPGRTWATSDLMVIQDVATDLSRGILHSGLYEQQLALVNDLQALDRAKSDFLSTVSHELRTPLTSISGYVELLSDGDAGPVSEEQRHMLAVVGRNAGRLKDLIEDLLTLSRMESNSYKVQLAPTRLSDLVDAAVTAVAPSAATRALDLHVEPGDRAIFVCADAGQLERAVLNLLNNAIKFTPPGGSVKVGWHEFAGDVTVSVTDTGIGIPTDEQPKLFSRFFRASNAVEQAIPGTGLGLTIVQTIVEQHRGRLGMRSAVGEGTTFTVRLPVVSRQPVPVGAA